MVLLHYKEEGKRDENGKNTSSDEDGGWGGTLVLAYQGAIGFIHLAQKKRGRKC